MILVEYVGEKPELMTGPETGTPYPFNRRRRLFVDMRDAVWLLNNDLRMVE